MGGPPLMKQLARNRLDPNRLCASYFIFPQMTSFPFGRNSFTYIV